MSRFPTFHTEVGNCGAKPWLGSSPSSSAPRSTALALPASRGRPAGLRFPLPLVPVLVGRVEVSVHGRAPGTQKCRLRAGGSAAPMGPRAVGCRYNGKRLLHKSLFNSQHFEKGFLQETPLITSRQTPTWSAAPPTSPSQALPCWPQLKRSVLGWAFYVMHSTCGVLCTEAEAPGRPLCVCNTWGHERWGHGDSRSKGPQVWHPWHAVGSHVWRFCHRRGGGDRQGMHLEGAARGSRAACSQGPACLLLWDREGFCAGK